MLCCVSAQPAERTIVFCNKIDTCRKVENLLKRAAGGGEGFRNGGGGGGRSGGGFDYDSADEHDLLEAEAGSSGREPAYEVLPYHAAIADRLRTGNLQVGIAL